MAWLIMALNVTKYSQEENIFDYVITTGLDVCANVSFVLLYDIMYYCGQKWH